MRHEKWQVRLFQHVPCGPAKDRLAYARLTISPHDNEIGINICGVAQQHVRDAGQGF